MFQSHLIHLSLARPLSEIYQFLAEPRNYAKWAAVTGSMTQIGPSDWKAQTEFGERIIRFTPLNAYGVLDHAVFREGDTPVMMPMRVAANQDGCELTFLFFRRPGVSDAEFASAIEWVTSDFLALQSLLGL
jgi:hypothetical protein